MRLPQSSIRQGKYVVGRITDIKIGGLVAQLRLFVGGQYITSIITTDEVLKLRLKKGQTAIALIKATDVTIMLPD